MQTRAWKRNLRAHAIGGGGAVAVRASFLNLLHGNAVYTEEGQRS